ncbi:Hsp70 protein-domain-containing protein [Hysterangium stoloniferum]|nr:Hsp70 protein-domain-containing protein [Hysterangium stoloniferum]
MSEKTDAKPNTVNRKAADDLKALGYTQEVSRNLQLPNYCGIAPTSHQTTWSDPQVIEIEKKFINAVLVDANGTVGVKVNYLGEPTMFTATQSVSTYLGKLKDITSHEMKQPVSDVVSRAQLVHRRAVIDPAHITGLNPFRVITDSTAVALGYERLKKILSANTEGNLSVESFMNDVEASSRLTREQMEQLDRIVGPLQQALQDAGLAPDQVDVIELVGSTRVPTNASNPSSPTKRSRRPLNQDETVGRGTTFSCAMLPPVFRVGCDFAFRDICPYSITVSREKSQDEPDEDTSLQVRCILILRPSRADKPLGRQSPRRERAKCMLLISLSWRQYENEMRGKLDDRYAAYAQPEEKATLLAALADTETGCKPKKARMPRHPHIKEIEKKREELVYFATPIFNKRRPVPKVETWGEREA